jgi:hypothetical protein
MEHFFFSKNRIFRLGPMRGIYFITFAFFFIITEIGREIYRPYIYQNGINDLGFADVIGNLLGTVAVIFFGLGVSHANRLQSIRGAIFVTGGITIYELLQSILPRGVLDWKDVVSTPVAGLFSLMLIMIIWRFIPDPLSSSEEMVNT